MKAHGTATLSGARETPLRRLALAGFQAVCEALYPDNEFGAPSWRTTDMVARAATHWDALPPQSRLTLEALYAGLELGGSALAPWVGRLSSLPVARRFKMLERMRKSRVWPLRFVAEAVKSSSTMIYLSHPAAMQHIGVPMGSPSGLLPEASECLRPAVSEVARKGPFTELLNAPAAPAADGALRIVNSL